MARSPELISHWYTLIDGMQASSQEFYRLVNAVIEQRSVPEKTSTLVTWQESGLLSAQRLYLRIQRGRLAFDVCAAPYGKGFFVSWRLAFLPFRIGFLLFVLLLATGAAAYYWLGFYGPDHGYVLCDRYRWVWELGRLGIPPHVAIGGPSSLVAMTLMLGAIRLFGGPDAILAFPVIGWLYKICFAQETYYRIDTALMFQESVRRAVLEVIDGLISQQGLRALSEPERQPCLRDLGKR